MRPWSSWFLSGRKALSRSTRGWWSGVTEATMAAMLIVLGVVLLVIVITLNVSFSTPTQLYMTVPYLLLQLLLGLAMIGIGTYRVLTSLWAVGASAERRGALVAGAGEIELLNELRRRRADLPTIPTSQKPPVRGRHYAYRLRASRRSLWGMITAGLLCVLFAAVSAVLIITAMVKYQRQGEGLQPLAANISSDWFAGMLAIPISLVALWALYRFVRQLLKLTSLGPTTLELANYPVNPGQSVQIFLSQTGRLRLKLIEAVVECVEEATFNQGTNVRTERRTVFRQRLFRKRGISVNAGSPFERSFEMTIPVGAMHSFSSSSNRVLWKIEICGQAKGFPQVTRSFEFIVLPTDQAPQRDGLQANLQPV